MNYLIIIAVIGWMLALYFISKIRGMKGKHYCPRCGAEFTKTNNIADDTFWCKKCGMTTYDRFKFNGTFEEKSKNY